MQRTPSWGEICVERVLHIGTPISGALSVILKMFSTIRKRAWALS
jgi:hypothetical protein